MTKYEKIVYIAAVVFTAGTILIILSVLFDFNLYLEKSLPIIISTLCIFSLYYFLTSFIINSFIYKIYNYSLFKRLTRLLVLIITTIAFSMFVALPTFGISFKVLQKYYPLFIIYILIVIGTIVIKLAFSKNENSYNNKIKKRKNKKIGKKYLFLLFACLLIVQTHYIKADSGWDSDYDSGGSSWDSGNDWDSGSIWNKRNKRNQNTYHEEIVPYKFNNNYAIIYYISISTLAIISSTIIQISKKAKTNIYSSLSEEDIRKVLPEFNKQEFLSNAYDIFINIQNAWSEFNYYELRKYLSDELFNTYKSQLKVLNAKKQKNVMYDFVKHNMNITKMENVANKTTLTVELIVSFYDYVVDSNNNVVRGTKSRKLTNHYELTFIYSKSDKTKSIKCPNCNATLNNNSNVCPYCKSTIVSEHYDWVMSKKEIKK